ncbi:SHOCT domain-containing protein [Weissella cibaria]|uniref:SHOCT domain-containing protein n=1 Tax=Weissella cibaria TaxID=137591 RepID=UPI000E4E338D|nr:SHOCT domain-containing protein [Weissella cibaria]MDK9677312.1 SHOCT domain-containing protein [Weissella cibaria]RHE73765.1 SHOCT domain-containing protein [Weissella cibaria]RHE79500.1 SHOCT domain-containing protein [Weissella cibaria]
MASALKLEDIAAKKVSLGYSGDTSRLAYVETSNKLEYLIGGWNALLNKIYVISFEEDGLLFMGINMVNQFTDNDKFIPLSDLGVISYKKSKFINGRLMFNGEKLVINSADGKSTEHIMYTFLAIAKWVKNDLPNVHSAINNYPTLKERMDAKKPQPETKASSNSNLSDLRELKSLLDDGIITQDDFDRKKAELLG